VKEAVQASSIAVKQTCTTRMSCIGRHVALPAQLSGFKTVFCMANTSSCKATQRNAARLLDNLSSMKHDGRAGHFGV
jgi:hypothetical protein